MPKPLASYVLFPFAGRNMPDADARTQTAQYLDAADDQSAARELQRVLSLSSPSFYRCALRVLGNRAAEDAVQEALLAAHKHLHQFRGQSQMSTWLTTIVCNCARMQLRKRPRQIHMPLDEQIGEDERYFISEGLRTCDPALKMSVAILNLLLHLRKCMRLLSPSLRRTFSSCAVSKVAIGLEVPASASSTSMRLSEMGIGIKFVKCNSQRT